MVHQHFMLVPVLTVAENILLGEETMANPIFLDRREARRRIIDLGRRFGFEIDPDAKVGALSVGWQQRVEILKALYRNARILVLDEPTAVLTPQETEEIFAVLRRLAEQGHSIVFISHKLYEVLEIADRITVIRRGKVVGSRHPSETDEDDLAELMVGRDVQLVVDRGESHPADGGLEVTGLRVRDDRGSEVVRGVDFEIRAGEILGIAGVAGNGQDELVEAIVGLRKPSAGTVDLDGRDVTGRRRPRDDEPRASATCPADRHRFGLVLAFSVADNLVLTDYYRAPYARGLLRNDDAIDASAEEGDRGVRHPDAVGRRARRDAVGRQPAEGRRRPGVRRRAASCSSSTSRRAASTSAASSSSTARRSEARRRHRRAARLRGARRGPRAVRPDRRHVSRPDRGDRRRPDRRQERGRPADGDRWPERDAAVGPGAAPGAGRSGRGTTRAGRRRPDDAGARPAAATRLRRSVRPLPGRSRPLAARHSSAGARVVLAVSSARVPRRRGTGSTSTPAAHGLRRAAPGSVGSFDPIVNTLVAATPLIFGGLAVALGFKAGLFNIGVQGQLLMGVLGPVAVGVALADAAGLDRGPARVRSPGRWPAPRGASSRLAEGRLGRPRGRHDDHAQLHRVSASWRRRSPARSASRGPRRRSTYDVGNAALPIVLGETGHIGIFIALGDGRRRLVDALPDDPRLRDPDRRREPRCRPLRRDAAAPADHPDDGDVGRAGRAWPARASSSASPTRRRRASRRRSGSTRSPWPCWPGRTRSAIIPAALLFGAMRAGAGQMQIEAGTPRELVDVLQAVILIVLVALPVLARRDRRPRLAGRSSRRGPDDHPLVRQRVGAS